MNKTKGCPMYSILVTEYDFAGETVRSIKYLRPGAVLKCHVSPKGKLIGFAMCDRLTWYRSKINTTIQDYLSEEEYLASIYEQRLNGEITEEEMKESENLVFEYEHKLLISLKDMMDFLFSEGEDTNNELAYALYDHAVEMIA